MEHIHDLSAKLQKGDFAYLGGDKGGMNPEAFAVTDASV